MGTWTPSSASGGGGASGVTLLSDTTLGADGTFDIQNISTGYVDLILSMQMRGTNASAGETLRLRFNNDAASTYLRQQASGSAGTAGASETATTYIDVQILGDTATANNFAVVELAVLDYLSTTKNKAVVGSVFRAWGTTSGLKDVASIGGTWPSTAPISRVQLSGNAIASLKAGSRLRILGRL